jgi:hypothetical protein
MRKPSFLPLFYPLHTHQHINGTKQFAFCLTGDGMQLLKVIFLSITSDKSRRTSGNFEISFKVNFCAVAFCIKRSQSIIA